MQERQLLGVLDCYQEVQAAGNSDRHAGGLDMQGTACIAWLPDGRFTGTPLSDRPYIATVGHCPAAAARFSLCNFPSCTSFGCPIACAA